MQTIDIPIQAIQDSAESPPHQSGACCHTADDGSAYCAVPQAGQTSNCGCNTTPALVSLPDKSADAAPPGTNNMGRTVRGWLLFGVACLTSPCCTPFIVPLAIALLAGTPLAAWLGHNLGWVYGALTVVSVISFVLAFRWLNKPQTSVVRPSAIPVITTQK